MGIFNQECDPKAQVPGKTVQPLPCNRQKQGVEQELMCSEQNTSSADFHVNHLPATNGRRSGNQDQRKRRILFLVSRARSRSLQVSNASFRSPRETASSGHSSRPYPLITSWLVSGPNLLNDPVIRSIPHRFERPLKCGDLLWVTRESCVIVLRLLTTGRPVCAAVAQHPMIYAIRFQVHRISLRALLDPDRYVHVSTKHLARRELSEPGCSLLFLLILAIFAQRIEKVKLARSRG